MSKIFHLNNQEYQMILDLFNNQSDFALIFDSIEQCYILFVHGSKDGYVVINQQKLTLQDIGKLLENHNLNICLKVVCCYGAFQSSYITNNVSVTSYVQNKEVMFFNPFVLNGKNYCNIHCVIN